MRFMAFVKMAEDVGLAPQALVEAMGQEMAQAFADGSIVDAGGLWGTTDSTEVRLAFRDAAALTRNEGERTLLLRRADELG